MGRPLATAIVGAAFALALAGSTPAEAAYSFEISVSGPASGTPGRPAALTVRGKNPPPAEYWFNSYFSVEALPAAVAPSCPGGHQEASQMAVQTFTAGGGHVTPVWVRENANAAGDWTAALAYTPRAPGRTMLCAYTNDGFSNTLARAQTAIDVRPAATSARKRCRKARRALARKKCRKRR